MRSHEPMRWRAAMHSALYEDQGLFVRDDQGPTGHFRTSVHASALFAGAMVELMLRLDRAMGNPDPFDLVDVGAGRGELLTTMLRLLERPADTARSGNQPGDLPARLRITAVELAGRPAGLDPRIAWTDTAPQGITGLLLATELLDNVPLDIVEVDQDGTQRYLLVDRAGEERLGPPVDGADALWLRQWWNTTDPATRAEIGLERDNTWADLVARVHTGLALAVDYGHTATSRPLLGTLAGYREGRQVPPVPDGTCDVTAHVAFDAVAKAGEQVAATAAELISQRSALRALGVDGARPPLALASTEPVRYLRELAEASQAAELTDMASLGAHLWLFQPIDVALAELELAVMGDNVDRIQQPTAGPVVRHGGAGV